MSRILGSRIETRVSLVIVLIIALIMFFAIIRAMKNFDKFYDRLNQNEELRIPESE
jgi:preprotein translocase subunit YajC